MRSGKEFKIYVIGAVCTRSFFIAHNRKRQGRTFFSRSRRAKSKCGACTTAYASEQLSQLAVHASAIPFFSCLVGLLLLVCRCSSGVCGNAFWISVQWCRGLRIMSQGSCCAQVFGGLQAFHLAAIVRLHPFLIHNGFSRATSCIVILFNSSGLLANHSNQGITITMVMLHVFCVHEEAPSGLITVGVPPVQIQPLQPTTQNSSCAQYGSTAKKKRMLTNPNTESVANSNKGLRYLKLGKIFV